MLDLNDRDNRKEYIFEGIVVKNFLKNKKHLAINLRRSEYKINVKYKQIAKPIETNYIASSRDQQ